MSVDRPLIAGTDPCEQPPHVVVPPEQVVIEALGGSPGPESSAAVSDDVDATPPGSVTVDTTRDTSGDTSGDTARDTGGDAATLVDAVQRPPKARRALAQLVATPFPVAKLRLPPARNVFFTDYATVFAKVAPDARDVELAGVRHALVHQIPTPAPLGLPRRLRNGKYLIAFEYLRPDASIDVHAAVPDLFTAIWGAPTNSTLPSAAWMDALNAARGWVCRIDDPSLAALAHGLLEASARPLAARIAEGTTTALRWTHGDLHHRNLVGHRDSSGRPRVSVLDWEWHGLGWPENDAARYLHGLLAEPDTDLRRDPGPFLTFCEDAGLDLAFLDELLRLRSAMSVAYFAANQFHHTSPSWLALKVDLVHRGLDAAE